MPPHVRCKPQRPKRNEPGNDWGSARLVPRTEALVNSSTTILSTSRAARKPQTEQPVSPDNATDRRVSIKHLSDQYELTPKAIRAFMARPNAPQPIRIGTRIVRYRLAEAVAFLDSQLAPTNN